MLHLSMPLLSLPNIDGILLPVTALLLGLLASVIAALLQIILRRRKGETTQDRINRLAKSLAGAVQLINQIEKEIEERRSLVTKLQNDIHTYKRIASLNRSEVEAVSQLLRGELRREGGRAFWQNAAVDFLFFVLGAGITLVLSRMSVR